MKNIGRIYWVLVGMAIVLLLVIGQYLIGLRVNNEIERRQHQVRDLLLACKIYARDHGDHFPRDFGEISSNYSHYREWFERATNKGHSFSVDQEIPCQHGG